MEELAEQAVDDVLEIAPELGEEKIASLIMTARAPWFV
jgi:N utilization substance protein A